MGSYVTVERSAHAEEFDAALTYLNAVSQRLSRTELLDIADALHELVRRRRGERKSWQDAFAPQSSEG
jgi:hypothetical protein